MPLGLRIVSTADLTELHRLDFPVSAVAVSPDGRRLLASGARLEAVSGQPGRREQSGLYVFDAAHLELVAHLQPGVEFFIDGFSRDGRYAYLGHWKPDSQKYLHGVFDFNTQRLVAERQLNGYFGGLLPVVARD